MTTDAATSESSLKPARARKRARHGSGSLYQQKRRDGTLAPIWWTKVYSHGRPVRESTGTDDRSAAEQILRERQDRVYKGLPVIRLHTVTITELLDDLQQRYDVTESRDPKEAKRRLKGLRAAFGHWRAAELTPAAWDQYVETRRRRDGVTGATLNRSRGLLLRAYRVGLESGKVAAVPPLPSLKEGPARQGFVESDVFEQVLVHLDPVVRLACRVLYTLGWRRSEVLRLERRQINLETGAITLERTKNGSARTCYVPAPLLAELREYCAKVDAQQVRLGRIYKRLFVYTEGSQVGRPVGLFRGPWDRACRAAGVPGLLIHDLRRSGARNMTRLGIPETVVMKVMGHKTRSMHIRYNITSDADMRLAAERMGALGMTSGMSDPSTSKTRQINLRTS